MDKNFYENFFSDFESLFNGFGHGSNAKSFFPFNNFGESKTEKGQDSKGDWIKQTYSSKDGSYKVTSFVRTINLSGTSQNTTLSKIGDLKAELEECVEKQEFEKAAKLRDKIKAIESSKEKIDTLKKELEVAVNEQNFEKAIELRDKIKSLEK
jgi:excinuclease UvrABC helicase subunit UvrB